MGNINFTQGQNFEKDQPEEERMEKDKLFKKKTSASNFTNVINMIAKSADKPRIFEKAFYEKDPKKSSIKKYVPQSSYRNNSRSTEHRFKTDFPKLNIPSEKINKCKLSSIGLPIKTTDPCKKKLWEKSEVKPGISSIQFKLFNDTTLNNRIAKTPNSILKYKIPKSNANSRSADIIYPVKNSEKKKLSIK